MSKAAAINPMVALSTFADDELEATTTVRSAPRWQDSHAQAEHRKLLKNIMAAEFAVNRGFKRAAQGVPKEERDAFFADKSSQWCRIVPCRPVGVR